MEKKGNTWLLLSFCVIWAMIIFVLCTMPQSRLPQIKIQHLDKVAHFGCFFVQSVLLSLLLRYKTKCSYLFIILLSTLIALVYGGSIEVLQSKFFNRTGDIYDLIADVLGGLTGALIYPAIRNLDTRTSRPHNADRTSAHPV